VFICGLSTMSLELTGSRVLAPYMGASIFVWTSLIGVILGALSLGYWWGGRRSDNDPSPGALSTIILLAAIWVAGVAFLNEIVLVAVSSSIADIRVGALVATAALFGVPSVLLGMVLPYAVRLKLTALRDSGATVGSLSAVSTMGSIAGTFLTGFVLIAYLSNIAALLAISGALLLAAILAAPWAWKGAKVLFAVCLIGGATQADAFAAWLKGAGFVDVNTRYSRVWIYDVPNGARPYRVMQINEGVHSTVYLEHGRPGAQAVEYVEYFHLGRQYKPDFKTTLMIGGAGYSFPKEYLRRYPEATMDVVEIDPGVTRLAKRYFGLEDSPRLRIFHEDGRTFLNRNRQPYDLIVLDAFQSYIVPFQLLTREAAQRMSDSLVPDGAVIMNLVGALDGPRGRFVRAVVATFKSVFPHVIVYAVDAPNDGVSTQNLILVALKSPDRPNISSHDTTLAKYLRNVWVGEIPQDVPVLTDAYAPVERYLLPLIARLPKSADPVGAKLRAWWVWLSIRLHVAPR